jgi:hypothetical protein
MHERFEEAGRRASMASKTSRGGEKRVEGVELNERSVDANVA